MSTRISGRMIGLVVVLFWVVMMGFLAYRELGGTDFPAADERSASRGLAAEETWMGLFAGKERVGHLRVTRAPNIRGDLPGILQEIEARAELGVLGRATTLGVRGSVWRPLEGPGAEFEFTVESGDEQFGVSGVLASGQLSARIVSAGESLPLTLPVDDRLVFSSGVGSVLEFPALEVGEVVRLESFDPLTLRKSPMRVRCVAEESIDLGGGPVATRRLEVLASGVDSQIWIDDRGAVVKMATPFGLTLQRIDPIEVAAEEAARETGGPSQGRGQSR